MSFDILVIDPDQESALIRLENMGRYVTCDNRAYFKEVLRRFSFSGSIDVTDWSRDAIYALLEFLSEVQQTVSLRKGSRYFTPVLVPEGPLLDSFVDAILSGDL